MVDLKGDGVGEIKMLKNIIKNPSFSGMRDELKEVRKSDKNALNPPKITRVKYDFNIGKKRNRKQIYDEIEDFDF
jgi:hypothetical protein